MYTINLTHLEAVKYTYSHSHSCDWQARTRSYATVALMLEGIGKFITQSERFTIKKGDIVFIPDGTNYISHWSGNPNSYLSVHFLFESGYPQYEARNFKLQKLTKFDFKTTSDVLEGILIGLEKGTVEKMKAVGDFYKFYSEIAQRLEPSSHYGAAVKSVQAAINYLESEAKDITVGQLADLCHLSESRFYTLFNQATGTSPIKYKNNVLIKRATQMLKSNMSIQCVSDKLGFSSPSYFRRIFKKTMGKTPKEYVKNMHF